jgi:hypothetical protein
MDANMMSQLSTAASTDEPSSSYQHRRHKSLSPCPGAFRKHKSPKSHRRKSSLGSLSKGISKLFSRKEDQTKDLESSDELHIMQSTSTMSSADDSWDGGHFIPPLSGAGTWAGMKKATSRTNRHRRHLSKDLQVGTGL